MSGATDVCQKSNITSPRSQYVTPVIGYSDSPSNAWAVMLAFQRLDLIYESVADAHKC